MAQNSTMNLKLAVLRRVHHVRHAGNRRLVCVYERRYVLIYHNLNPLMNKYLGHFYLFTMLLFICLSVNPCVCVTHCAFPDLPTCICVWYTAHVYLYEIVCCNVYVCVNLSFPLLVWIGSNQSGWVCFSLLMVAVSCVHLDFSSCLARAFFLFKFKWQARFLIRSWSRWESQKGVSARLG